MSQLSKLDYKNYFENGVSFQTYLEKMNEEAEQKATEGLLAYVPMNLQRVNRILKTYTASEQLLKSLSEINHPIHWLVITENWCGDAAQIIPVIQKIAELSEGKIQLKLVYRDQNLPLMDAHLTGNSRSIPKLIQLDAHFNLNAVWGPRPNEAQELVLALKKNPATADKYSEELHKWYAQNKQAFIERDLIKAIQKGSAICADCMI
ncbi:MAG: thioredoxin family protein [Bacteroidia bacterium]|nr:thioredoxin family protein [Bacteroidia bacterium]